MGNARRSRAEACLLTIYGEIKMVFYPIQYDLGDDLGDCGQDTYSSPIITNLKITLFWNFDNDAIDAFLGKMIRSNKLLLVWVVAL